MNSGVSIKQSAKRMLKVCFSVYLLSAHTIKIRYPQGPADLTVQRFIRLINTCTDKYKQMNCGVFSIRCCFCYFCCFLYFLGWSMKLPNSPLIVWLTSPLPRNEIRIQKLDIAPACFTHRYTHKQTNKQTGCGIQNKEYGKQVIKEVPVLSRCNNQRWRQNVTM